MATIVNHATKKEGRFDTLRAKTVRVADILPLDASRSLRISSDVRVSQGAPVDLPTAGANTLTIAQLASGLITKSANGAATFTMPTAALIVAGLPGVQVDDAIDFSIINSGGSADITLAVAAGTTIVGQLVIEDPAAASDNSQARFRLRVTSITAAAEAAILYRLT